MEARSTSDKASLNLVLKLHQSLQQQSMKYNKVAPTDNPADVVKIDPGKLLHL